MLKCCLGDRGYGLKTWLMTPYANPETPQEVRYNNIHAHTHAVERTFDVLKGRWMCLDQIQPVANYFEGVQDHPGMLCPPQSCNGMAFQ